MSIPSICLILSSIGIRSFSRARMTNAAAGRVEVFVEPALEANVVRVVAGPIRSSSHPAGELSPCLDSLLEMTLAPAGELEEMNTIVPRKHNAALTRYRIGGRRRSCVVICVSVRCTRGSHSSSVGGGEAHCQRHDERDAVN